MWGEGLNSTNEKYLIEEHRTFKRCPGSALCQKYRYHPPARRWQENQVSQKEIDFLVENFIFESNAIRHLLLEVLGTLY